MTKDYYKILGIAEFDTAENIKSAYRKLARKWHPDIAGSNPDVLTKFKEINEAYEVLSNTQKKEEYDRLRRFYSYAKGEKQTKQSTETTKGYSTNPKENTANKDKLSWEEILFGLKKEPSHKKDEKKSPKKGENIYTELEINVLEAVNGTEKVINVLQTGVCPKCGGRKFINGSICTDCHGKGEYETHKKFTVKIPAGIKNHSKIRLSGEGCQGTNGGTNGDLYITVNIKDSQFTRTEGLNIYKTVPIAPFEAVLGSEININTLGGTYKVKLSPNTQNGQKIRLAGCGIVQNEKIGDMIITVEIKIPKSMSNEEIALYRRLAEISESNIRDTVYDR